MADLTEDDRTAYRIATRKARAAERQAERDRVLALFGQAPRHGDPDTGTEGAAQLARPHIEDSPEGRSTGSASPGQRVVVRRMTVECVLDGLLVNHHITERQWGAGMKFRRVWLASVALAKVSADYVDPMSSGGSGNQADDVAARRATARAEVDEAIAVLGMMRSAAVIAVCGQDEGCNGRRRWLVEGLDALVTLWKIPADFQRFRTTGK